MADLSLNALGLGQVLNQFGNQASGLPQSALNLGQPNGQNNPMFMAAPVSTLGDRIAAYQSALQNTNLAPKMPTPNQNAYGNARLPNGTPPLTSNDINKLLLRQSMAMNNDHGQQQALNYNHHQGHGLKPGQGAARPVAAQLNQVSYFPALSPHTLSRDPRVSELISFSSRQRDCAFHTRKLLFPSRSRVIVRCDLPCHTNFHLSHRRSA